MAVFANQKVYLAQDLRKYAEAIFGALPHGVGFKWRVGTPHASDPDPETNSAAIDSALLAAGAPKVELIVVVLD